MNTVTGNIPAKLDNFEFDNDALTGELTDSLPDFSDLLASQFSIDAVMPANESIQYAQQAMAEDAPWQYVATNMPLTIQELTAASGYEEGLFIGLNPGAKASQSAATSVTLPTSLLQTLDQSNGIGLLTAQPSAQLTSTDSSPEALFVSMTEIRFQPAGETEQPLLDSKLESLQHILPELDKAGLAKSEVHSSSSLKESSTLNILKQAPEPVIAGRINWMLQTNNKSAEIRLDPPDLGSLDIQVNLNKDSANVTITTQSHQVREALESSMPRLKEMLENSGINLGGLDIRSGNQRENDQQAQHSPSTNHENPPADVNVIEGPVRAVSKSSGLLDTYA